MKALEIENLEKSFGEVRAVRGLNLSVEDGELFALLGVNGAGKSTTIRMTAGLTPVDAGQIRVYGFPAGSDGAKAVLGVSPQETAVASKLTARENLLFLAGLYGKTKSECEAALEKVTKELSLSEILDRRAGTLSGGWQRRLSIAMALIASPKLLILDEPTLGLDVLARRELWDLIRSLHGKVTVLLTTHYLEEAEALSDRIALMREGELVAVGTAEELKEQAGATNFEDAFVTLVKGGVSQ